MSLTVDILRSYRAPRAVLRRQLGDGRREDRVLVYLMLACLLIFIAQWPALSRAAQVDPSVPFQARLGGALMGVLFVLPLVAYGLAFLLWLVVRVLGPISGYGARLALFWALMAVSPLMLLQSAMATVAGPGGLVQLFGLVVLAAFLAILVSGLRAALEDARAAA